MIVECGKNLVKALLDKIIQLFLHFLLDLKIKSFPETHTNPAIEVIAAEDVISHRFPPAIMLHITSLNSEDLNISTLETLKVRGSANSNGHANHAETLRNRGITSENEILKVPDQESDS